jgi:hypothetical protein
MTQRLTAIVLVLLLGDIGEAQPQSAWKCTTPPIEPCVKVHGRLSSQNGIALAIWIIGTNRRVGVSDTEVPPLLDPYLSMTSPDHGYIFGDFEICPLQPDTPGHLRFVCVAHAEKLVVQPHDSDRDRPRPPFRLRATWPR